LILSRNDLTIKEKEEQYVRVSFSTNDQLLLNPGKPILPKVVETFELPFGATNIDVQIVPSETFQQTINKQIQPSPAPMPLSAVEDYEAPQRKDQQLYNSNTPYPSNPMDIILG